jgi:hypothetical protein
VPLLHPLVDVLDGRSLALELLPLVLISLQGQQLSTPLPRLFLRSHNAQLTDRALVAEDEGRG